MCSKPSPQLFISTLTFSLVVVVKLLAKLGLIPNFILLCDALLTLQHRLYVHNCVTFLFYFPGLDDDGSEFHEHIFLEKHLEDFPKQGPIRLFMELVTCGLSKNPYLSVRQKVEHIEWFRNYFNEKRDILKENNIHLTS